VELNKRKPGQSKFTTQRKEDDKVQILSGTFEGKTTGTPISLIIYNQDMRSKDYGNIKDKFRPGHADFTYFKKYGIRDYRGGGRSSARETAARVAAGAIAKKVLEKKIGSKFQVIGAVTQLGILGCDVNKWSDLTIRKNPFFCPDKSMIKLWEKYLLSIRKSGSSCGAVIEIRARGVPIGLGAPIYSKLDMDIASAMMSINAVKGVNIGSGMNSAQLSGEQNSDEISQKGKKLKFNSNNAGGILGGISTGQEIVASFAVKPTSSILTTRKTINKFGKNTTISVKGRHDPCVGIRAVPVGEAMMNCVLLDHYLMNKAQCS
jgi:chorismate synthase